MSAPSNSQDEKKIIRELIAAGLVGAGIGTIISKNKKDGAISGAILASLIYGSIKLFENAKKSGVPFLIVENDTLYRIEQDGTKTPLRKIQKNKKNYPPHFNLNSNDINEKNS
ncbi:MAG: hypothetical protein Fur0023_10460 [Bacteroidia bacterium]